MKLLVSMIVSISILFGAVMSWSPSRDMALNTAQAVSQSWHASESPEQFKVVTLKAKEAAGPQYSPSWEGRQCRHDTGVCVDTRTHVAPDSTHAYALGHCPGPRYVQCHYNIYASGNTGNGDDWIGF